MATVQLNIAGHDQSGPSFRSAVSNMDTLGTSIDRLKSRVTALGGAFLAYFAADKLVAGFAKGVEAVDDFQQSVVKTAAMITSLQGGENVAENYRQAKFYAEGLQNTLMKVDANTTLNLTSLQAITEEMIKQGIVLDGSNAQQVEGFTRLANAVAVYSNNGRNEVQVRQEVSALLRGEVDQNSQLASMLKKTVDGPLQEWVNKHKQSGDLMQALGEKLAGFGPASKDLAQTWGAVKSSLETAVNLILRAGFSAIVKDLVGWLEKANEYLKSHADLIGVKIKEGWETFKSVAEKIPGIAKAIYDNFEPFAVLFVGGALIKGITGTITLMKELAVVARAAGAAMLLTGGAGVATGGAAAGGAAGLFGVGAAATAKFWPGVLAGGAQLMGAGAAGLGLGYALQPAVRWADKKIYQSTGWNLTGEAMYNEAKGREEESVARYNAVMAKRKGADGGAGAPEIDPQESEEEVKQYEKFVDAFNAKLRAIEEGDPTLTAHQKELMKVHDEYEKLIELYPKEAAELKKLEAYHAQEVTKRQEMNDAIKETSDSFKDYLRQAEEEPAQNNLAGDMSLRWEEENKWLASLQPTAGTDALNDQMATLGKMLEDMPEKADAIKNAMVALGKPGEEAARAFALAAKTAQDEVDALYGKDLALIKAEQDLAAGIEKGRKLQEDLALAWKTTDAIAISSLSQQLISQNLLNAAKAKQLNDMERLKTLTGEIVGFNNGIPIFKDSYAKEQAASGYTSNAALTQQPAKNSDGSDRVNYWGEKIDAAGNVINPYNLPGRASGGPVQPYATYRINEDGTEYLTMGNKGGYITPAGKTAPGQNSAASITIGDVHFNLPNITNQSTADDLARAAVPKILDLMRTRLRVS